MAPHDDGEQEPLLSRAKDEEARISWRSFGLGVAATVALAAVIVVVGARVSVGSSRAPSTGLGFGLGVVDASHCETHFAVQVQKFHDAVEAEFTMSHDEHEATYGEKHKGVWHKHNGCAVGPFLPDHTKLAKLDEADIDSACEPGKLAEALEKEFEKVYKEHCEHWRDAYYRDLQWPQACHWCDTIEAANGTYLPAGEPPHVGFNFIPGVTDLAGFCHFDPAKMGQCMKNGLNCWHKEAEGKYVTCKETHWPQGNSHHITHTAESTTSHLVAPDTLNGGHTHNASAAKA